MCKKREKSEQEIEKAIQEHEKGILTFSQVQKKSNISYDAKKVTESAYHEYLQDLEEYNKMIDGSQFLYKDWLNKLQDLDEERIRLVKTTLNGFFSTFLDTGDILKDKMIESISSAHLINSQTDIKIFIDENRSKNEFFKKKEFVSYDYSRKIIKSRQERIKSDASLDDFLSFDSRKEAEIDVISLGSRKSISKYEEESKSSPNAFDLLGLNDFEEIKLEEQETRSFNDNKEYVKQSIEGLFGGKEIATEEQLKIFELLHETYITPVVSKCLLKINSPKKLANVSTLKSLSEIVKYLITVSIHDKQNDFEIIHVVMGCSQLIYAIDDVSMRKILLTHMIKDHGVWQDISKWILWIYKVIESRRQEFLTKKLANSNNSDSNEYAKKSTGWIKGISKMFIGKAAADESISDDVTKNIIFNVLSQFIYNFANFGVSLEGGKKLILYFCEKYSLDKMRVHTVLSEFDAVTRRGGHILTEQEKMLVPMLKRNERLKKFGHDDNTMVMGLILPYIGDDITATNILKI